MSPLSAFEGASGRILAESGGDPAKAGPAAASTEVQLLLCCARTRLNPETAKSIRGLVRGAIDWDALITAASRHGVLPLLHRQLSAACPDAVPSVVLEALQEQVRTTAAQNLFLTGELIRVLRLFEAHGIAALPYKGPALAASVYGNVALRQFADLDVLVQKKDVLRVADLLVEQGYRQRYLVGRAQQMSALRTRNDFEFERGDGRVLLEVHWSILPAYYSFDFDRELLWRRARRVPLFGVATMIASPEDLLLMLCVHGARHMWDRLIWICDVAELTGLHQDIDWEGVIQQAGRLGAARMLLLGLFLANDLLGASLPETIARRVTADAAVASLAARVCEELFGRTGGAGNLERRLFHLKMRERLRDRVCYALGLAATPSLGEWALLHLPARFHLFYYLVRPTRLVGKYAAHLWSSVHGRAQPR